jgi:hypothetical protein
MFHNCCAVLEVKYFWGCQQAASTPVVLPVMLGMFSLVRWPRHNNRLANMLA